MDKVIDEEKAINRNPTNDHRVYIFCPACKEANPNSDGLHCLNVSRIHRFNGNYESPTFEPSLMAATPKMIICHSYVREGMIQYLSDCTHGMAGQTVPLLDIPEKYLNG